MHEWWRRRSQRTRGPRHRCAIKLSLATGLIYTYTTNPSGQWYWTALSYRTGKTVYQQHAGSGLGYNNNYAGIAIGRNHTEYLGTLGGLVALRDG